MVSKTPSFGLSKNVTIDEIDFLPTFNKPRLEIEHDDEHLENQAPEASTEDPSEVLQAVSTMGKIQIPQQQSLADDGAKRTTDSIVRYGYDEYTTHFDR